MGSKTEADKMDGKSFPILEDLAEDEDLNIKVGTAAPVVFALRSSS